MKLTVFLCILAILKGKQRDWRQPVPTDEEEADMLKLWIVGASGQIGSAINEVLDPLEMEVFNTDKEEFEKKALKKFAQNYNLDETAKNGYSIPPSAD